MENLPVRILTFEEGYRESPYHCSEGYPTIGIGQVIGSKGQSLSVFKFTVPLHVAQEWLQCNIDELVKEINAKFSWFKHLSEVRQTIIISMCYQLGVNGFSKFKNCIAKIESGDYGMASIEMLDSKWARQTPDRAGRHADVMRADSLDAYNDLI